MSNLKGQGILIEPQELFTSSSTQGTDLGASATTGDGRTYRYALAGISNLVVGNVLQGPAFVANHIQLTPTAAASGATSVTVTLGNTLATANQYSGGYLVVTVDSGTNGLKQGAYQILSHPAAAALATLTVTLVDPLVNLITTSAKIDLVLNPYNGLLQNITTGTNAAVGAATYAITAAQYGWVQVQGACALLNDAGGTITVGNNVVVSTSVGGAVKSATGTVPVIGTAMTTVTASQLGTFYINLV